VICLLPGCSDSMSAPGRAALDLVILTADKNTQFGLEGLLTDPARLKIRNTESKTLVHPRRDPGVLRQCHEFLRSQQRVAARALVIFDREGCGSDHDRDALEGEVEKRLAQNGWQDRSAAIVIDPELEAWVWGEYTQIAGVLGWSRAGLTLREWLMQECFLQHGQQKPDRPKEALKHMLYTLRTPRSSSIYLDLASRMSFDRCTDPAFLKLKSTLQSWFPPEAHS